MTLEVTEGGEVISLDAGSATHVGQVRSRNEDSLISGPLVFAVADGMGGHDAGDVASRTITNALADLADRKELDPDAVLGAIRSGDDTIRELARSKASGMGTTLTGVALLGSGNDPLMVFNVGDSRVYRFRAGVLSQLTHDHSVVQELIDSNVLTAEAAEVHPERHVITRAIGAEQPAKIDWTRISPEDGDRILITSDGLVREVSAMSIQATLASGVPPQAAVDELVEQALQAGGHDNISVIVVDVVDSSVAAPEVDPLDSDTQERVISTPGAMGVDTTIPRSEAQSSEAHGNQRRD